MDWEALCRQLQARIHDLEEENAALRLRLGLFERRGSRPTEPPPLEELMHGVHNKSAPDEKIRMFRTLFRGREDVFARRWYSEKTERSGYSPVCANEWLPGVCGKPKVSCAKCPSRELVPLSDNVIYRHLRGKDPLGRDVAGLYPMLPDETCCLLALDFDDEGWWESVSAVRMVCEAQGLPCAVERSHSGEGAHLWLFFDRPVPCAMARKLGSGLLTAAMERCSAVTFDSYDRMFPSQDTLPSGGFGNLIALPLQGQARKRGNTVFVDENLCPYPDQWAHLDQLKTISAETMEDAIKALGGEEELGILEGGAEEDPDEKPKPWRKKARRKLTALDFGGPVELVRANLLYLPAAKLSSRARNRILRLAAFPNPDFYRAQAMRFPTYGKPRVICTAEEREGFLALPRGCEEKLLELLDEAGAAYTVQDETNPGLPIRASFHGELREEQRPAAESLLAFPNGVLSATTAFGKTVIASYLIGQRKTNTLILVHTQALLNQWKAALGQFLTIDEELPPTPKRRGRKKEYALIGQLGGTKNNLSGFVDIAILQSLVSGDEIRPLVKNYGMVIVDECHHVSAVSFEKVLKEVNARYVYGLTATPTRQDGHQAIIYMQCGSIRYRVSAKEQAEKRAFTHAILPRFTAFAQPLTEEKRWTITQAYGAMAGDESRNGKIVEDVLGALAAGRTPLVLTERYAHAKRLHALLSERCGQVILLSGKGTAKEKRRLLADLNSLPPEKPLVIVATGRYVGEGFDLPRLDTLFLAMPIAWKGTLAQYAGRLHRDYAGKQEVIIYDYVDVRVPMLERMYHKRLSGYAALGYTVKGSPYETAETASLIFDHTNFSAPFGEDICTAKKEIVVVSPYLHMGRVRQFLNWLAAPGTGGAKVKVITGRETSFKPETWARMQPVVRSLRDSGIQVEERPTVYQRFAVLDQELVWYGSVNLLGYDHGDEGVMRLHSAELAGELLEFLRGP